MEDLDLNLYNYDLHELLTLFKLKEDFTKQEFKDAKNIVYAVHPDKSNLNKEYFIFHYDIVVQTSTINIAYT